MHITKGVMEQRLSLVTLGVAELDRSIRFYEGLGWRRAMKDAKGVAFFQLGGMGLSLFPLADLALDAGLPCQPLPQFRGMALAHNVRERAEVDQIIAQAEHLGGTIQKLAKTKVWGGYAGYISDPDAHLWEIAWNPSFPIDPAGNMTIPE
jgi:catechol 2,3-dioxygenase-like lactoylglutathione lyase family enzyme